MARKVRVHKPCFECGGAHYKTGGENWIQDAFDKAEARGTVGDCTGTNFGGPKCPKGSKKYNMAKTLRGMAKKNKKAMGGPNAIQGDDIDKIGNRKLDMFKGFVAGNTMNALAQEEAMRAMGDQAGNTMMPQAIMALGGSDMSMSDYGYTGKPFNADYLNTIKQGNEMWAGMGNQLFDTTMDIAKLSTGPKRYFEKTGERGLFKKKDKVELDQAEWNKRLAAQEERAKKEKLNAMSNNYKYNMQRYGGPQMEDQYEEQYGGMYNPMEMYPEMAYGGYYLPKAQGGNEGKFRTSRLLMADGRPVPTKEEIEANRHKAKMAEYARRSAEADKELARLKNQNAGTAAINQNPLWEGTPGFSEDIPGWGSNLSDSDVMNAINSIESDASSGSFFSFNDAKGAGIKKLMQKASDAYKQGNTDELKRIAEELRGIDTTGWSWLGQDVAGLGNQGILENIADHISNGWVQSVDAKKAKGEKFETPTTTPTTTPVEEQTTVTDATVAEDAKTEQEVTSGGKKKTASSSKVTTPSKKDEGVYIDPDKAYGDEDVDTAEDTPVDTPTQQGTQTIPAYWDKVKFSSSPFHKRVVFKRNRDGSGGGLGNLNPFKKNVEKTQPASAEYNKEQQDQYGMTGPLQEGEYAYENEDGTMSVGKYGVPDRIKYMDITNAGDQSIAPMEARSPQMMNVDRSQNQIAELPEETPVAADPNAQAQADADAQYEKEFAERNPRFSEIMNTIDNRMEAIQRYGGPQYRYRMGGYNLPMHQTTGPVQAPSATDDIDYNKAVYTERSANMTPGAVAGIAMPFATALAANIGNRNVGQEYDPSMKGAVDMFGATKNQGQGDFWVNQPELFGNSYVPTQFTGRAQYGGPMYPDGGSTPELDSKFVTNAKGLMYNEMSPKEVRDAAITELQGKTPPGAPRFSDYVMSKDYGVPYREEPSMWDKVKNAATDIGRGFSDAAGEFGFQYGGPMYRTGGGPGDDDKNTEGKVYKKWEKEHLKRYPTANTEKMKDFYMNHVTPMISPSDTVYRSHLIRVPEVHPSKVVNYEMGGEYELSQDEIDYIMANGGSVEYLD